MDLNLSVFQEPRGVMRIIHFILSICAFATISGYSGSAKFENKGNFSEAKFEYPFQVDLNLICINDTSNEKGDFSSDAKFFVATGVLAMLYAIGIIVVYIKFDKQYKSNAQLPLIDFVISVIFGVLWLSSSAAWANGLTGLKNLVESLISKFPSCSAATVSNFSTLNISVVFGFLNFFVWAADLWFLYKETAWFQGSQLQTTSGV